MNRKSLTNVAASVHQRLLNKAKATGRPFNEVLQYFGMERFLHRLSTTVYAESFVLKGALLFRVWDTPDTRATRDIDFLAYMDNSPDTLAKVIPDICLVDYTGDGLAFDSDSVEAHLIKEGADYEGVRVRLRGLLGKAVINLQIDVGSGDILSTAIKSTLDHRQTEIMDFDSLRVEVLENVNIDKQWRAFLRKSELEAPTSFTDILLLIEVLLGPVLSALKQGHQKKGEWLTSGSWV